jgi:glycopeptide antibiotics resistance protein
VFGIIPGTQNKYAFYGFEENSTHVTFSINIYMQSTGIRTVSAPVGSNKLTIALLIIYIIVLFWILLFKLGVHFSYMPTRSVNLVPFDGIFSSNGRIDKAESILNVAIFVPLGIYIGVLFKKWGWRRKLLSLASVSLTLEVLQFIFRIGAFDVTDIITNTTGGMLGLLLFEAIEKVFNNGPRSQNFINAIATVGTATTIALLVLLKLNMLPIRYQ